MCRVFMCWCCVDVLACWCADVLIFLLHDPVDCVTLSDSPNRCDYYFDFLCIQSRLNLNSSLNRDITSLAIQCLGSPLLDSLSSKFPNLREITLQSVKDFRIFRFCPTLSVVRIEYFIVKSNMNHETLFDDLRYLTELKSFKFQAQDMTAHLYVKLFNALPKTLVHLEIPECYVEAFLETYGEFICNFNKLETLQSIGPKFRILSKFVCQSVFCQ
jgi:hypothetical protein